MPITTTLISITMTLMPIKMTLEYSSKKTTTASHFYWLFYLGLLLSRVSTSTHIPTITAISATHIVRWDTTSTRSPASQEATK